MLRTDGDPELRVFDPVIRFLHWLTLFLIATIFILAFSIDFASSKEGAVALIQLHRSFGVTVWVVTLGRLVQQISKRGDVHRQSSHSRPGSLVVTSWSCQALPSGSLNDARAK